MNSIFGNSKTEGEALSLVLLACFSCGIGVWDVFEMKTFSSASYNVFSCHSS